RRRQGARLRAHGRRPSRRRSGRHARGCARKGPRRSDLRARLLRQARGGARGGRSGGGVMPAGRRSRDRRPRTARRGPALEHGASALLTGVIMVGASLLLWIGVPAGWLWVGSQVQGSSGSLGTAIAVMMVGAVASIVALAWVLGKLNRAHERLREARGAKSD